MRYRWLDGIRGAVIVSMILYHACWDLVYMKGVNIPFFLNKSGFYWQQSICWSFILLSGFCAGLGNHPFKRGVVVSVCGIIVSVVTYVFAYDERILFGVLTFIGAAMMVFSLTKPFWEKVNGIVGLFVFIIGFVMFYPVNGGFLSGGIYLPKILYANKATTFLGFMEPGFYSTDYFSFFPWFWLFMCGYFIFRLIGNKLYDLKWNGGICPPLEWMGRHSLVIYMLHQPLLSLLLGAI